MMLMALSSPSAWIAMRIIDFDGHALGIKSVIATTFTD